MHEFRFEGIIIGYENWGDADRLISFYTPTQGKIEAVAKGVRHEKSKLKGHLEILTHGEFMIAKNRGRGVLTDAISYETFSVVRNDPVLAYVGAAIAEMYDVYLFPHAADEALWEVLAETLGELSVHPSMDSIDSPRASLGAMYALLHDFARKFLKHLGYLDIAGPSTSPGTISHDALLAHTEIAGPTFSEIERGLRQLEYW